MTAQTLKNSDGIKPSIGLESEARKEVAKAFAEVLATTYSLYLKTHYYHWNVTGANFIALHEMFGAQYAALTEAADEIAERIRALGFMTPGTIAEFQELSSIKDDSQLPTSWREMVSNLVKANELASRKAKEVFEIAEKHGDEASLDMMVGRINYHDKTSWMLRSTIEEGTEKI